MEYSTAALKYTQACLMLISQVLELDLFTLHMHPVVMGGNKRVSLKLKTVHIYQFKCKMVKRKMKTAFVHHYCTVVVEWMLNVRANLARHLACHKTIKTKQLKKQTNGVLEWKPVTQIKRTLQQQAIGNLYKGQKETGLHCASLHEATKV